MYAIAFTLIQDSARLTCTIRSPAICAFLVVVIFVMFVFLIVQLQHLLFSIV
jgi:hypothetical protein